MLTVVVDLTRHDLIAFNLRWVLVWRRILTTYFVIQLLVAVFVIYKHGVPATAWNWFALALGGVGGALGAILVGLLLSMLGVFLNAGKVPGLIGRHEFTFVSDGLLEKTDANETLTKWGGAVTVLRTDKFVLVEVAPGLAHILPRRAFLDERHFDEFCAKATQLLAGTPNKSLERTREG